MADESDVENALVATTGSALFPGVPYTPGAVQTTLGGQNVIIARGWPPANQLDAALASGAAYVTVFPQPNSSRDTTRYGAQPQIVSQVPITFTATIANNVLTFAGTCTAGQVVGVNVGGVGYAYRMTNNDTPQTVAAWFTANIPGAI